MADRTPQFVFVGFWTRVLAALIDAAINWAFVPITIPMMRWAIESRNLLPHIAWSGMWTVVWIGLVVRFGGTPGKLVVRARIVDAEARFLSWGRAILRAVPTLVIAVNSLVEMSVVSSRYPDSAPHSSFMEIGGLMNDYGQPYSTLAMVLGFFIYIDIGVILFNRRKRAIHDFIAGSYVITLASYQAVAEPSPGAGAEDLAPQP